VLDNSAGSPLKVTFDAIPKRVASPPKTRGSSISCQPYWFVRDVRSHMENSKQDSPNINSHHIIAAPFRQHRIDPRGRGKAAEIRADGAVPCRCNDLGP